MSVVKRVSKLESIDSISLSQFDLIIDLLGSVSVLIKLIIEHDLSYESHLGASD